MKVYKMEVMVIDYDEIGDEDVVDVIENTVYPNRCIDPCVFGIETKEVEWSDNHQLNNFNTREAAFRDLFKET